MITKSKQIFQEYREGKDIKDICKTFNMSKSNINKIIKQESYIDCIELSQIVKDNKIVITLSNGGIRTIKQLKELMTKQIWYLPLINRMGLASIEKLIHYCEESKQFKIDKKKIIHICTKYYKYRTDIGDEYYDIIVKNPAKVRFDNQYVVYHSIIKNKFCLEFIDTNYISPMIYDLINNNFPDYYKNIQSTIDFQANAFLTKMTAVNVLNDRDNFRV